MITVSPLSLTLYLECQSTSVFSLHCLGKWCSIPDHYPLWLTVLHNRSDFEPPHACRSMLPFSEFLAVASQVRRTVFEVRSLPLVSQSLGLNLCLILYEKNDINVTNWQRDFNFIGLTWFRFPFFQYDLFCNELGTGTHKLLSYREKYSRSKISCARDRIVSFKIIWIWWEADFARAHIPAQNIN